MCKLYQTDHNVKVTTFGVATFSYLAVQPPIDIELPLTIGLHKETCVRFSLGNYFTPSFVCSQYTVPRNIKLVQTLPSQGTNSRLGGV